MADFVNTVDLLGDDAVVDAILGKTITEMNDDVIETLKPYAFSNSSALISVNFPNVKTVKRSAFESCAALKKADLGSATSMDGAFYGCKALDTLIIRTETMCVMTGGYPFYQTPIASGTGYIYVPAALVDTYKADSVWSTFANQIRAIEDYPEITG